MDNSRNPLNTVLHSTLMTLPGGVCVLDRARRIRFWNRCLKCWSGVAEDEALYHPADDLEGFQSPYVRRRLLDLFNYGVPIVFTHYLHPTFMPMKLIGGGARCCRIRVTAIELPGEGRGALFLFEDITKGGRLIQELAERCERAMGELELRRNMEDEIAQERLGLEQNVELRTRELRNSLRQLELTNMRLEQANKHKSRFLSSMSHELRTPLNAVLGFNDLLKGQYFGPLNDKQQGYAEQIEASSKHLLALISDLLDIAKIDAGTMELALEDIPVEEFIYASQTMMNPQFKEKELDVNTYVDPELTTIQADRRKWKQIMLNLLSNAVKYTPAKGRINIRVKQADSEYLRVEVEDTGIGIDPSDLDKIFNDFYQSERVRDQQLGGTGIGLALTTRMVELHKGQIGAESELGKGSLFWFTLPLSHQLEMVEDKGRDAEVIPQRSRSGKRRILVVEDDPTNLELVLDMLSIHGHEVQGAVNGRDALRLAEEFQPELILMDICMPVMDGLQATRALRRMDGLKTVPIIALTANTSPHARQDCLDAGCLDYIPKPIRANHLFAVLENYLPKSTGESR